MLDGAEECRLSGPIGELVPFTLTTAMTGSATTISWVGDMSSTQST
jgi:hypothetical protein